MAKTKRVLLVDDNADIRAVFKEGLESHGFEVIPTSTVNRALHLIATEKFDVLLSDLHMPDAGDGFTVVSAMRHTQPDAVTLVMSGYPAVQESMSAILLQADEILVKPVGLAATADLIQSKLLHPSNHKASVKQAVAKILEREKDATIHEWLSRAEQNTELVAVPLSGPDRTGHLPQLLSDLVYRLRLVPNVKRPSPGPHTCTVFCGARQAIRCPCWSKGREYCRSASSTHSRQTWKSRISATSCLM